MEDSGLFRLLKVLKTIGRLTECLHCFLLFELLDSKLLSSDGIGLAFDVLSSAVVLFCPGHLVLGRDEDGVVRDHFLPKVLHFLLLLD